MVKREPLTEAQREDLALSLLAYLKRENRREGKPKRDYSIRCHVELHTDEEVNEALGRLLDRGLVRRIERKRDVLWAAFVSEDECRACEVLRTTYRNPESLEHMCTPATLLPSERRSDG